MAKGAARFTRVQAEEFVECLSRDLRQCGFVEGETFIYGGSWRRKAPTVGDLDVVLVTEDGTFKNSRLPGSIDYKRRGDQIAQGELDMDTFGTMHIDLWACKPSQLGAFLWFITGPKELNVAMRSAAIKRGMNLSQYALLLDDQQIDDGTEKSVAKLLGWKNMPPEDRQTWASVKAGDAGVETHEVKSSKGDKTYIVSVKNGKASCTCTGYSYRQRCKHSAQYMEVPGEA